MAKRKSVSKKTRFEVFKRDCFTCQYCGSKAPDVILEMEHVTPVSKGGTNAITNLVTACKDCNSGKSDRLLSDKSTSEVQRHQAELLQERKDQIDMLLKWQEGMVDEVEMGVDGCEAIWSKLFSCSFTDTGRASIAKLVKKFGLRQVLDAINKSHERYEDADTAFSKLGGICRLTQIDEENPFVREAYYVRGILRNRFHMSDSRESGLIQWLTSVMEFGCSPAKLREQACIAANWSEFEAFLLTFEDI